MLCLMKYSVLIRFFLGQKGPLVPPNTVAMDVTLGFLCQTSEPNPNSYTPT